MVTFLFSVYFGGHFRYHNNGYKSYQYQTFTPELLLKRTCEKQPLFLAIDEVQNSLLIYVTLCVVSYCLLNSGYRALLICLEYQIIKKYILSQL